jgi:hypothetical protein
MLTFFIIVFFSFSEAVYSNEAFFNDKKNKRLLNNRLIKYKIFQLYPLRKKRDRLLELNIHRKAYLTIN